MKYRIHLSPPHLSGTETEMVARAMESGYIAPLGPFVDEFEEKFCKYTGYPYALAVSSGTAALHLALLASGVSRGDIVFSPSMTFIGGVSPVYFCSAKAWFFDSDESWTIDVNLVKEKLFAVEKSGADKPKAIIATDIYGMACDYEALCQIEKDFGVNVIVDAAESLGASDRYGKRNSPKTAFYSFNGNKIITTSSGGMLASHDKNLIDYAKHLSRQAREPYPYYQHNTIGHNYRMSNILAAIGIAQLSDIEARIERKKTIFQRYKNALGTIPGVEFMPCGVYGESNYWLSVIILNSESRISPEFLRVTLEEKGIETRPVWKPMHLQPVFSGAKFFSKFELGANPPICEIAFERGLCLPSGCGLSEAEQEFVISSIQKALYK